MKQCSSCHFIDKLDDLFRFACFMQKLKKTNNSPSDPSKDVFVPHPPNSQQRDGLSERRLSNGFVNGGSALSDDLTQSTKTERDRVNDIITGDDRERSQALTLCHHPTDWIGERSRP